MHTSPTPRIRTLISLGLFFLIAGAIVAGRVLHNERSERRHLEQNETELIVSNETPAIVSLYEAGKSLQDTTPISEFNGKAIWLPPANYFLAVLLEDQTQYIPITLTGYRSGPDEGGSFAVTVRTPPTQTPPVLLDSSPAFRLIPSGSFLFGDRLNPKEPHYVWLTSYFISPFEVTNVEFREFLFNSSGYRDDENWTIAGRRWKSANKTQVTARLEPSDDDYDRFGKPDLPVVKVNWFEAFAYCRWLTHAKGKGEWWFSLPTEAEWEKAARGPDGFDYALGRIISDAEMGLYNWRKNPSADTTVMGAQSSMQSCLPNRFGLYHMTGNVVEWTQSVFKPFSKAKPYDEYERNGPELDGLRVARGGSWYSASVALLYIPYRDAFQPEHSTHDLGFRVVARPLP